MRAGPLRGPALGGEESRGQEAPLGLQEGQGEAGRSGGQEGPTTEAARCSGGSELGRGFKKRAAWSQPEQTGPLGEQVPLRAEAQATGAAGGATALRAGGKGPHPGAGGQDSAPQSLTAGDNGHGVSFPKACSVYYLGSRSVRGRTVQTKLPFTSRHWEALGSHQMLGQQK